MAPAGRGDSTHDPEERIPIVGAVAKHRLEAGADAIANGMEVPGNV
jgi:hypothetical protein